MFQKLDGVDPPGATYSPGHLYSPTKSASWRSGGDTQFSSSRRFWKVPSQKTLVVADLSLLDLL